MSGKFEHKHPGDFLTFTTPLFRRIPRPGPSQNTRQDQRLDVLEEKCDVVSDDRDTIIKPGETGVTPKGSKWLDPPVTIRNVGLYDIVMPSEATEMAEAETADERALETIKAFGGPCRMRPKCQYDEGCVCRGNLADAIRAAEQAAENRGYLRGVQDMTEGARSAEARGAESAREALNFYANGFNYISPVIGVDKHCLGPCPVMVDHGEKAKAAIRARGKQPEETKEASADLDAMTGWPGRTLRPTRRAERDRAT